MEPRDLPPHPTMKERRAIMPTLNQVVRVVRNQTSTLNMMRRIRSKAKQWSAVTKIKRWACNNYYIYGSQS